MNFRTEFAPLSTRLKMHHPSCFLCMGSCFAEQMFLKLRNFHFDVQFGPYGITFNPLSIAKQLKELASEEKYNSERLVFHQGLYHSMDHHGVYSSTDPEACLLRINADLESARKQLLRAEYLIVTLGSSHYYTDVETSQVVSNCHKIPSQQFFEKRASTQSIIDHILPALEKWKELNPALQIILSVSPVRYLKHGMIENARSKASLLLACDAIINTLPYVHYFPAYELIMDDLRDYRFMKSDLVHPNDQAIEYIWEYFSKSYFDEYSELLIRDLGTLLKLASHKPIHAQSDETRTFQQKLEDEIHLIQKKYPHIIWRK